MGKAIDELASQVLESTSTDSGTQLRTFVTRNVMNSLFERRVALVTAALRLSEKIREKAKAPDLKPEGVEAITKFAISLENCIEKVLEESTEANPIVKDGKQVCKEFDELQTVFKRANHAALYEGISVGVTYTTDVNSVF